MLLVGALLALGTAAGLATVGVLVALRAGRTHVPLGGAFFALFWISAAGIAASGGLRSLAAWARFDSFPLVVALEEVTTPLYCTAGASLLIYVVFLRTGTGKHVLPVALYYLALLPLLRYHVALAHPIGYAVTDWNVNYVYERPLATPGYAATLLLTIGPLLAALGAYAALAFTLKGAAARYRVLCVSLGLSLWITTEALAFATGLAASGEGELLRRLVALGSTLVILTGYLPPAYAKRRWGARGPMDTLPADS